MFDGIQVGLELRGQVQLGLVYILLDLFRPIVNNVGLAPPKSHLMVLDPFRKG
jgi:hypothetical protein